MLARMTASVYWQYNLTIGSLGWQVRAIKRAFGAKRRPDDTGVHWTNVRTLDPRIRFAEGECAGKAELYVNPQTTRRHNVVVLQLSGHHHARLLIRQGVVTEPEHVFT